MRASGAYAHSILALDEIASIRDETAKAVVSEADATADGRRGG